MSATIIDFPVDRCRPRPSVIESAESQAYVRAVRDHGALSFYGPSILAMMTLALQGTCAKTVAKATAWLHENYVVAERPAV